jgi:ribokinase
MDTTQNRAETLALLDSISGSVAVVGSLNADYSVLCERIPGPGETVLGHGIELMAGGKSANQAACAARIGAKTHMVGAVGTDPAGEFLLSELRRAGADASGVAVLGGQSGSAIIEVDAAGENNIVVSPGTNGLVDAEFVRAHRETIEQASVLGLCLEFPIDGVLEAARIARAAGVRVLLNDSPFSADLPRELIACSDVLLVNEHELAQLLGLSEPENDDWGAVNWLAISAALGELGFSAAIVTLGGDGSVVLGGLNVHHVAPVRVEAQDTTGCGDAFMGAVLAGLASGLSINDSADLASYVSAYAATKRGAQNSYGTSDQIRAAFPA